MTTPRAPIALCLLLAFLAAGTAADAQDKKGAPDKDPISTFEPKSGPGEGQKFLQKFVGDWDVVKTFHPRSGAPIRAKGECRQAMIHGGRFLQSDFTFGEGEGKTTGKGLIGFEAGTGLFTSVWTDSRATRMSFRQGKEKFDGKQIVLVGRGLGGDKARASRTVTRLEDDGRKIVHRQYTEGEDGKERVVMELELTRKGKPSTEGK